ncbi:MAG: hypothetical protein J6386_07420 [Candidatus Synoicihabitans palmerolidicus]|nr:hypothetical protein [Candidatus Synoicihabitans palmerolidicus]
MRPVIVSLLLLFSAVFVHASEGDRKFELGFEAYASNGCYALFRQWMLGEEIDRIEQQI